MPGPSNTLLIEGSFEELADELAHYIGEVQKKQTPPVAGLQEEVSPLLEQGKRDDVLKKLVTASTALNTAPEKGDLTVFFIVLYVYLTWNQNSPPPTIF